MVRRDDLITKLEIIAPLANSSREKIDQDHYTHAALLCNMECLWLSRKKDTRRFNDARARRNRRTTKVGLSTHIAIKTRTEMG